MSETKAESALSLVKERPAESTALAAALGVLICWGAGIDEPAILAALTVVVGAIPGVVTWIVQLRRKEKGPAEAGPSV